jgi:hypothetical protein
VIDGDQTNVSQQSSLRNESVASTSSDTSSNVPSLASSSSSTPRIDAVDMGSQRNDPYQQVPPPLVKEETKQPRLQLGMMGVGGYKPPTNGISWTDEWSHFNTPPVPLLEQRQPLVASSCCQPQMIPEEPVEMAPPSSCCAPKTAPQFGPPGESRHDSHQPIPQAVRQLSGSEHDDFQPTPFNNGMNFGMTYADTFEFGLPSFNSATQGPGLDFFGELEGRDGCGNHVHIPNHLRGNSGDHNCHCGENCDCLGCATHPANKTTTEYVRYHNELASRVFAVSSRVQPPLNPFQQHSPYTIPNTQSQFGHMHPTAMSNVQQNQFGSRVHPGFESAPAYGLATDNVPSWHLGSQMPVHTPTNELQQFHIHTPTHMQASMSSTNQFQFHNENQSRVGPHVPDTKSNQQTAKSAGKAVANEPSKFQQTQRNIRSSEAAFDHESPSTDDDTSTLSPSSFHIQQFNMPGCNDVTGTCQCGEGCKCTGCLTHSGHGKNNETNAVPERSQGTENGLARAGLAQDLNGFNIDNYHHDITFSPTVPG